jgi:pyruvate dehydrogenase kinase 2/3/4
MREYGLAPDVSIYGDPTFTFAYVPSHLHHMIFELVKNSLRAVQDRFEDADDEPPPIRWARNMAGVGVRSVWGCGQRVGG